MSKNLIKLNHESQSTDSSAQEFHLTVTDSELTAVQLLAAASQLSGQEVKQAMQKGCVWHSRNKHTQRLRRAKKSLQLGDEVHMYYNPMVLAQQVDDALLISDEGDYSIWYKPFGMLCLGSKWSDHTTINRFVETHLTPQRPAFIVHRLDKATTGLLVIAHSKSAARSLSHAFESRKTVKHYQAIVHGDFNSQSENQTNTASDTISDTLTINTDIDGKSAITHATCIAYNSDTNRSLLNIKIDTGRKHQIRIHLSSIGFPIVGDRLYGNDEEYNNASDADAFTERADLQLCSVYLKIPCPNADTDTAQDKEYSIKEELTLVL
ncbi:pseudouridine synthase family protein [Colwelliaceae bacterium BS250]